MNSVIIRPVKFNKNCGAKLSTSTPLVNQYKNDKGYLIELMVPGFTNEEIDVNLEKNILTIQGIKSVNEVNQESRMIQRGFSKENFKLQYKISENIDNELISASNTNGVLTIYLPLKSEYQPFTKKIEIK
ncbi:MAG: Hsp20/alpha crystallin family protein [Saprospiraceae bacterium]|nr:Hsp20/alpha crystallin family protein [Saprospiraceae bacterium]